jgi:hypothetical protein
MKIIEIEQPRVFYKGYNPGDTRRIRTGHDYWDSKMFAADQERKARFYGTHVRTFDATPDAKILYQGTRQFISIAKGLGQLFRARKIDNLEYHSEILRRAEQAGYDAVYFTNQGDIGTVILHPEKFIERSA